MKWVLILSWMVTATVVGGRLASIVIGGWFMRRGSRRIIATARAAGVDPDMFRLRMVADLQAAGRPRWMVWLWERSFRRAMGQPPDDRAERR